MADAASWPCSREWRERFGGGARQLLAAPEGRPSRGDAEAQFDTVRYIDLATDEVHEARRDEVSFFTQLNPQ